jgi:hypothetical protein
MKKFKLFEEFAGEDPIDKILDEVADMYCEDMKEREKFMEAMEESDYDKSDYQDVTMAIINTLQTTMGIDGDDDDEEQISDIAYKHLEE